MWIGALSQFEFLTYCVTNQEIQTEPMADVSLVQKLLMCRLSEAAGSISWHGWFDFLGPAVDAAGEGLRLGDALTAQPHGDIETAHSVMTIADHRVVGIESLEIGGNRTHGNELGTGDAADFVLPRFANVDEQQRFAVSEQVCCGFYIDFERHFSAGALSHR